MLTSFLADMHSVPAGEDLAAGLELGTGLSWRFKQHWALILSPPVRAVAGYDQVTDYLARDTEIIYNTKVGQGHPIAVPPPSLMRGVAYAIAGVRMPSRSFCATDMFLARAWSSQWLPSGRGAPS